MTKYHIDVKYLSVLSSYGYDYGVYCHFKQYFSYFAAVGVIGGGNRSTQRKPTTCRKTLTNLITQKVALRISPYQRDSNFSGERQLLHRYL